jgi:hypothetical protein
LIYISFIHVVFGHLYFFWELSVQFICWSIVLLVFNFISSLYILTVVWIAGNDFLLFCRLSCNPGNYFLWCFWYDAIPFINSCSLFKKSLPMHIYWSVFPKFFCSSLKVSGCSLKSLIHFELTFVHSKRSGSCFSLLHVDNQFFQHHMLKRLSFLKCAFLAHLSKIRWL